jgi:hypothetical protein
MSEPVAELQTVDTRVDEFNGASTTVAPILKRASLVSRLHSNLTRRNSATGQLYIGTNDLQSKKVTPSDIIVGQGSGVMDKEWIDRRLTDVPPGFLLESSNMRCALDIVVLVVIAYASLATPYYCTFKGNDDALPTIAIVRSSVFFLDLVSHAFFTSYMGEGMQPVFDHRKIATRYLCTYDFVFNFIAVWPWSLLKRELVVLELLRCLTAPALLARLLGSFRVLDQPKALAIWGFTKLLLFLVFYLHWVACLWFSISKEGWFTNVLVGFPELQDIHPYWVALAASLHLTVGSSGLDTVLPSSDIEAKVQSVLLEPALWRAYSETWQP